MATLRQVAVEAGVSLSTVVAVLNPGSSTRTVRAGNLARVMEAANRLGYVGNYHARSMRLGRAHTIAVALDIKYDDSVEGGDLAHPYFSGMLGGVEWAARRAGYNVIIMGSIEDMRGTERAMVALRERRVDAALLMGDLSRIQAKDILSNPPANLLMLGLDIRYPTPLPTVVWDEAGATQALVEHLAELGHRNLLWLGTQSEDETPSATVRREHAFIECVWKMGLHGASCRIPELAKSNHKDQWLKAICTGLRRQLESTAQNPPTAIICFNETMAAGAMQCLTAMGLKVPENMSLAAFDNHLAPMLNPPLTTIDPGLSALGTRCFELAIKMLENPGVIEEMRHHREILPFKLVVRQSTAPAPSGLPNFSL